MIEREFDFTDRDFDRLRNFVSERTGISLSEAKKDLVYGRLAKRLRVRRLTRFSDYADLLARNSDDELEHFTNAITTNLTSFFRESHHFDYLRDTVFPELKQRNLSNKRIRIWSAGCSTGEEPYSIAMTVRDSFTDMELRNWDVKILATDLDTNCVQRAEKGVYDADRIKDLDAKIISRWFEYNTDKSRVKVDPKLNRLITFRHLNLMLEWPFRGPFDVIFCRNVVIYFDKDTQGVLFDRFADYGADQGHLILGHSESMHRVCERYELLGKTTYRRIR